MKSLILELIIIAMISRFSQSITVKNLNYIYSGASKLGYVNSKLTVECPAKAQFYLWKFYQMQSDPQVLLQQEGKSLTIDPATVDKSGVYECKGTTGFTNTDTNVTVKIIDPQSEIVTNSCSNSMSPQIRDVSKGICFFKEENRKLLPKIGDNVALDCTAAGENLKYYWTFIGNNRMKSQIQTERNISKIIIKSVIPENEGIYKCEVGNIYGERISRTFTVVLTEMTPDANMEIIGKKQEDLVINIGQQIILKCEVKSKYHRIHSIKWGTRIKNTGQDPVIKSNMVSWDQFTYNLLPETDIKKSFITQNHIECSLTLLIRDNDQSGIYTCLAMDATGRTAHKIFNITTSTEDSFVEVPTKSYFFLLYILLPVILIFAIVCAIIYCSVKSSSKNSHNSVPLKKFNTMNTNNPTKEPISNYYYPVSNNRPPLPQPNESQVSLASPNTLTSYSSYGNYHMPPTNQPSCCSSNGV